MAKLSVHQTDGSNGYEPGTWEWRITGEQGDMSFDGGWPSEASALEAGQARLRELSVPCALCGKLVMLWDTYSPADEAPTDLMEGLICAECDTEVTGRMHARL